MNATTTTAAGTTKKTRPTPTDHPFYGRQSYGKLGAIWDAATTAGDSDLAWRCHAIYYRALQRWQKTTAVRSYRRMMASIGR